MLARRSIASQYSPGVYHGRRANDVIQHLYRFYERKLYRFVQGLASRDAAEFLLFQYDEATRILHGKDIVDPDQAARWLEIEGKYRRSIKYIVELMCLRYPGYTFQAPKDDAVMIMEGAVASAEAMADLAEQSERLHSLFPNDSEITLLPEGAPRVVEMRVTGAHKGYDRRFFKRLVRDRNTRAEYVGFLQFDVDPSIHAKFLDQPFRESFGATYLNVLSVLRHVIDTSKSTGKGFDILFLHRDKIVKAFKSSELSEETISTILTGFTVDPANMEDEERRLWKPKQEHRALWRGFFHFPHPTGDHLAFSRAMARENLLQLINRVCYRRVPSEWISPSVSGALGNLSSAAGKWFESVVIERLRDLGIEGRTYHRSIGQGPDKITIPDDVGEIDFLGHDPRTSHLVVLEDKMTFPGLEASFWRDDVHEFVARKRSYVTQFRKKLAWVRENRDRITKALGLGQSPDQIQAAMLTLYPCIAREFIADFECVSLTEFMLDFKEAGFWPYSPL
jgi:hypothetical protein